MKIIVPTIFATLLSLSLPVMAKAPVVDDSEGFVLLEEQAQAAEELPVAQDESFAIADDIEEPVNHASKHLGTTTRNTDFVNKLQSLQKELQELRGQVEIQAHELDELKQQRLALQDIDTNIGNSSFTHHSNPDEHMYANNTPQNTDSTPKTKQPSSEVAMDVQSIQDIEQTAKITARLNPADEQISYLAAYDLVKQKQFSQATQAMQQFLNKYPHGGYSANAHYWLGELYLANKEYSSAIEQFNNVIQNFKNSSKHAPSRLKLGYALAESGRIAEAKEQLTTVMSLYPDTSTAKLARNKLTKLGG
ncbi:MAG: tol-pal system protein YbgF [Gammaproteobacteria bacterium]